MDRKDKAGLMNSFFEQEEYISKILLKKNVMSERENRIADYLIGGGREIADYSIGELAEKTGTSPATIVRFCKTIGYNGYAELKFHMQQRNMTIMGNDMAITAQDHINSMKQKAVEFSCNAIRDSIMHTEDEAFEKAISEIVKAKTVYFFGSGSASGVALVSTSLFLSLGIPAFTIQDSVLQLRSVSYLDKNAVVIGINYDGYMKDVGDVLMVAKKAGASTILITSCDDTLLCGYADTVLLTLIRNNASALNISTTSICQLATIQTLQIGVWLRLNKKINPKIKQQQELTELKRYDYKQGEIEVGRVTQSRKY